jgi:hypothetical protein
MRVQSKIALGPTLLLLCILVLYGILVAGLWPFHAPTNEVTWLGDSDGVRFGNYGTVLSSGTFETASSPDDTSVSLELWLRPRLAEDSSTILAFFTPEHAIQFSLRQSKSNLALQKETQNEHIPGNGRGLMYLDEVFGDKKLRLIAIASGRSGTKIYIDGTLARTETQFRLSIRELAGQLVLGTSPVVNDAWSGELRGLAFYKQELTHAQVSCHFETWTRTGRPDLTNSEQTLALYLFDERQGIVVHDQSGSGVYLNIPKRYMILREKFLEPPWREFYPHWGYWKNVLINIGGFIPLGFFFCAYLTLAGKFSRPALITVILGAAVSVTIEVLQAYLPTRDSGITDIITNTLGTGLGVLLYRWKATLLMKIICRLRAVAV